MGLIFTEKGNSAILALCEMTDNDIPDKTDGAGR